METKAPEKQWRGQMCTGLLSTTGPGHSARLTVGPEQVKLVGLLGNFVFTPQDIERVERAGFFPWLWTGIRIRHNVPDYPKRLMFWPQFALSRTIMQYMRSLGHNVTQ